MLAVIGQSKHNAAIGLYTIGTVLFCIVLIAGVVMIYNTLNISVMERVRQFGLLRCVGASQSQIRKLVKREGLTITVRAIPAGVILGMLMAFVCTAILKFFNNTIFAEIQLFSVSMPGIAAGVAIGFLTVFMASLIPANKAAQVSPLNAVTNSNEIKISKKTKKGLLSKLFNAETAIGINNAVLKKRTLVLMSCSIGISIIMFLGFNVLIDFMHSSIKTTKPYTPDITLSSEQGISNELFIRFSELEGAKKVYGRMFGYVEATFDATRLTDEYKKAVKGIKIKDNGLLVPPEKSWLISYDKNQLKWAKEDLIAGVLSEEKMNEENGIVAVIRSTRNNNIYMTTVDFKLGDEIYIEAPGGTRKFTVMGILSKVPFDNHELTMTTFITTEKLFTELTGKKEYDAIDLQLRKVNDEETVEKVKSMAYGSMKFMDSRQKNSEMDQLFLTMAVFVYGFVGVIALISILNIVNTMNTSVASKMRYIGVMRAVGMSSSQLNRMVLVEGATYSLSGFVTGSVLGVMLQRWLIVKNFTSFNMTWEFPLIDIVIILLVVALTTVLSVMNPLKRIKQKGISESISSL